MRPTARLWQPRSGQFFFEVTNITALAKESLGVVLQKTQNLRGAALMPRCHLTPLRANERGQIIKFAADLDPLVNRGIYKKQQGGKR